MVRGGKTLVTGDKVPAQDYVRKLNEIPALKAAVTKFMERPELQEIAAALNRRLTASVTEFILEGLHVQNRLNKNVKGGEGVYKPLMNIVIR